MITFRVYFRPSGSIKYIYRARPDAMSLTYQEAFDIIRDSGQDFEFINSKTNEDMTAEMISKVINQIELKNHLPGNVKLMNRIIRAGDFETRIKELQK